MKDLPDPHELDEVIARMRVAVLTASFRKLRYRHEPSEVAAMLTEWKSNRDIFDAIESKQGLITKMAIGWRKLRRSKNDDGY